MPPSGLAVLPPSLRRRRRPGFALLLTLVVLALAAVILGISARRSTTATRSALQAERDLRHKWSLQAGEVFLEQANALLTDTTQVAGATPRFLPARQFELTMSGERVVVLLADEQAKPNLNALAQRLSPFDLGRVIETMGGKEPMSTIDPDRPFWCLEQLRPGITPEGLLGAPWPDVAHSGPASAATLVGDGKLYWPAATPAALAAQLRPELSLEQVQVLAGIRQEGDAQAALKRVTADWTIRERQVLDGRITVNKPQAWSAWVAVGPPQVEARPVCYRFTLLERKDERPVWRRQEWNPAP